MPLLRELFGEVCRSRQFCEAGEVSSQKINKTKIQKVWERMNMLRTVGNTVGNTSFIFRSVVMALFVLCPLLLCPFLAKAEEDIAEMLKRVEEFKNAGKFAQALNELGWAEKELQRMHIEKLKAFFPATVPGLTAGEYKVTNAMGLMSIERGYRSAEGGQYQATIAGSSASDGAAAQGMGALAGLAQMASMMEAGGQSESVRIKSSRATLANVNGKLELNLPLSGGLFFKLEQSGKGGTKEQLLQIANALDPDAINLYINQK